MAEPQQKLRQPEVMQNRKPPAQPSPQIFSGLNPASFSIGPVHICDGNCNHGNQNKQDAPQTYSSVNIASINIGPIQGHVHGPGCGCSDQSSSKQEVNQPQSFSASVNPALIMLPPGHVCDGTCDHSGQGKKDISQPQSYAGINPTLIMLPPGHVCDGTCNHNGQSKSDIQTYSAPNTAGIVLGPIQQHIHGPGCGCSDQSTTKKDSASQYSSVNAASLVLLHNSALDNQTDSVTRVSVPLSSLKQQQMNNAFILQQQEMKKLQTSEIIPIETRSPRADLESPQMTQQNARSETQKSNSEVADSRPIMLSENFTAILPSHKPKGDGTQKKPIIGIVNAATNQIAAENKTKAQNSGQKKEAQTTVGYSYAEILANADLRRRFGYLFGIPLDVETVSNTSSQVVVTENGQTKTGLLKLEQKISQKIVTLVPIEPKTLKVAKFISADKPGNFKANDQTIKKVNQELIKLRSGLKTEVKSLSKTKAKIVVIESEIRRIEIELKKATKAKKISLEQIKTAKLQLQKLKKEIKLLKEETKIAEIKLTILSKADFQIRTFINSGISGKPKFSVLNKMNEKQVKKLLKLLKNKKIILQLLNSKKKSKKRSYLHSLVDKIKAKLGL